MRHLSYYILLVLALPFIAAGFLFEQARNSFAYGCGKFRKFACWIEPIASGEED